MLERAAAGHLCGQPLAGQNLGQFAAWFTTPTERDASAVGLLYLRVAVALALAWLACAVCAKYCVEPWLPRSSQPHENQPAFIGRHLFAAVKSAFCAYTGLVGIWHYGGAAFGEPHDAFLGRPGCATAGLIEATGVMFGSFELADSILCSAHGIIDRADVLHHAVHMVVAWVIRYHCVAPFATAALLCQETSSIFLNFFLLFRNRTRHWSNTAAFLAFALNFFVFRIGSAATRTLLRSQQPAPLGRAVLASCPQASAPSPPTTFFAITETHSHRLSWRRCTCWRAVSSPPLCCSGTGGGRSRQSCDSGCGANLPRRRYTERRVEGYPEPYRRTTTKNLGVWRRSAVSRSAPGREPPPPRPPHCVEKRLILWNSHRATGKSRAPGTLPCPVRLTILRAYILLQ